MNLETRARDAATGLRTAPHGDVDDRLRKLHRTYRRRTAGKVVAALAVVAVALGAVQVERDRGRVQPVSPLGQGVLVFGSYSETDWSEPLAKQGIQTYPRFFSADPATRRFLATNEEGTGWNVMTPGRDEPLARIPCGACFTATLGPGPDEVTTINEDLTRVVVWGHDGRYRRDLGASWPPGDVNGVTDGFAWSPDRSTLAEARWQGRGADGSLAVVLRGPESAETTLYQLSEQAPPWHQGFNPDHPREIWAWGTPRVGELRWAPDSSRLAFTTLTTTAAAREHEGDLQDAYQLRLFVADTATGQVDEIADLGFCDRRAETGPCFATSASLAWAPDGRSLAVLRTSTLTHYDLTGRVLSSEPANTSGPLLSGPLVWLESD